MTEGEMEITTLKALRAFVFERVINEDSTTRTITLLGTFPSSYESSTSADSSSEGVLVDGRKPAILRVEQRPLRFSDLHDPDSQGKDAGELELFKRIRKAESMLANDIYYTLDAWLASDEWSSHANLSISVISPATPVHIRKYTAQPVTLLRETPHLYQTITAPFIASFPPSRTQWIADILSGTAPESAKILVSTPKYIVLPDMKWDGRNPDELYLLAIARDGQKYRSMRDLRYADVGWLEGMRREVGRVVKERWPAVGGIGGLRMYVHYQPSYYQFHVHIVNANHAGYMGMRVGQSHLLEDIISLLSLDDSTKSNSEPIMHRLTFTYGLGREHGLYQALVEAQDQEPE